MSSPATCSNCGSLLPSVPTDPRHPYWCPSCVARKAGISNFPAIPPPVPGLPTAPAPPGWPGGPPPGLPSTVVAVGSPRLGPALLVGVASAGLAGLAWWAVVSLSGVQFTIGAIAVGFIVGHGVLVGARCGGAVPAMIAAVATIAALIVAEYFIVRSITIKEFALDIPLWSGFDFAREVVNQSIEDEPLTALFWALAVGTAVVTTVQRSRQPVV